MESGDRPSIDPALRAMAATAREDLAGRLHVPVEAIWVVSAEVVTWPDAGLGCRAPGMRYAQVPVDGARIVLSHGGREFAYHAGGRRALPFLCEHPG